MAESWQVGDHVTDGLGRSAVVIEQQADRVLVCWGTDRGQTFTGSVLASSLRRLVVAS